MAHEFAHYEGALGPEGKRRTVTYYGPVVGGLPIQAWHCPLCGLLRLAFPDGRKEERHLFPGAQPGLLAEPAAVAPEHELYGLQPRVSGLSAGAAYMQQLVEQGGYSETQALHMPRLVLPPWDALTWLTVLGLAAIGFMLFLMGVLAVNSYSTPGVMTPLAIIVGLTFAGLLFLHAGAAAFRRAFPAGSLSPSAAEAFRVRPVLDSSTRAVVTLLLMALLGLFAAGLLAVYTYATPGAELPVFILSLAFAVAALFVHVGAAISRRFTRR